MNRQRFIVFGASCDHEPAFILDVDAHPAVVVCTIPPRTNDYNGFVAVQRRAEEMRDMLNREQQVRDVLSAKTTAGGA